MRERKALAAAHGDVPLNVNEHVWQAILDREKGLKSTSGSTELDMRDEETDEEELEEELEEDWLEQEYVSDISDEDMSDLEEASNYRGDTEHRVGGPKVEIEYEQEMENASLTKPTSANW